MSAISSIEWTDRTWNPTRGCSVISPGCVNCYAMKQAHRFSGEGKAYEGLTKLTKAGPQWTGKIRTVESALLEPLSWRKPALVFVNSMSDLFHEDVADEFIDKVFAVMALADRHTFQILTKRPERMRDYLSKPDGTTDEFRIGGKVFKFPTEAERRITQRMHECEWLPRNGRSYPRWANQWPLPNVWLGVSVENQHFADARIPELVNTPAAVRFLSLEPLLEHVDLMAESHFFRNFVHWVIVGGESGPGARPTDLAWIRSIVQQCHAAGVACFVKQLGADPFESYSDGSRFVDVRLTDRKGGDIAEFPEELRVREFPNDLRVRECPDAV